MAAPKRRWRAWRLFALVVVVLATLAGGSIASLRGPWLRVAEVNVPGVAAVPATLVQERADVLGRSMLLVDPNKLAQRVAALPRVREAKVERLWPRTVRVSIVEREPWAVWTQAGRSYLVDQDGHLLEEASAPGLWTIRGLDAASLSIGGRVDPGALRLAQRLAEAVPAALGAPVQGFEYLERAGLVVITSRGRARFDTEADFDYKLAVWQAALAQAAKEGVRVSHMDLRFGTRPFLR
jgi:cell division protein FtsQ